jgi:hypothetical protein
MTLNRRPRRGPVAALGLVLSVSLVLAANLSSAAEAPVGLGTAGSFAVLAGAGVTNTGPTVVSGDLGACPTPAITGFPPGTVNNGTVHAGDAVCLQAQSDLTVAYVDAASRAPTVTYPGVKDLGGETLTPGVYRADSFAITGTLTLDAQGDPDAVFIFQAGSTLITAPNSRVVLVNGAQACNVYWQVGSSATLGVGSTFIGNILALTAITANTNAQVQGRLLARNAAVTLDSNTVTVPSCAPTPTTTTSTSLAPTTSTSSTSTTTSTTLLPATTTTSTTLLPATTTTSTTLLPITVPPITVPPITVPPITTTTTTVAATTSTSSTTTTGVVQATTTTLAAGVSSTSSTTTSSTTTTMAGTGVELIGDTSTTSTTAGLSAVAVTAGAGGSVTAGGAQDATTLARTGGSVRWVRFWAGIALAVGGLLVLAAREDVPASTGS